MKTSYKTELLHVLWNLYPLKEYISTDGKQIRILGQGEYDETRDRFCGAKVKIGDDIHHGDIVIWAGDQLPRGNFESTVLQVTPVESASILRSDGEPIPQVIDSPDPVCTAAYENLKVGRTDGGCAAYVVSMERHERVALFTRLMADRLYRKYGEVMRVFERCEQNWNETLYVMLMRAMGKPYDTEAYGELALKVPYKDLCKEKSSCENLEAMLIGASGLFDFYEDDAYIRHLKSTFDHLCHKYTIKPMRAGQWKPNKKGFPLGKVVLRLAQLSSLFMKRDFLLQPVMECRTVADIHALFDAEASVYWSTHYKPGEEGSFYKKKLGHDKANSLGINFIAPMQFTYGVYTCDESLKESALDLIEKINAEGNKITSPWREKGVMMESAFDTQAIIQLNNEFCVKGFCWRCPVGKRVIKGLYGEQSAQKM